MQAVRALAPRWGAIQVPRRKREGEEVKYICYFEFKPEDLDKVIPLFQKMIELRGKPGYPKGISPTYAFAGETSGFTLYEVDDPQQISNHYVHYHPLLKLKWKPIAESTDVVATYLKSKKK